VHEELGLEEYVRDVLPHSAKLWAGGRSFERYVADLRDFASGGYGRRRFRLRGIRADGAVVASCKIYERDVRCGDRMLRAIGIGAVFTRETHRGRGLATAMLASLLDAETRNGTDFAFLFSNIRPQFYADLGFATLPSRIITLRADLLAFERIEPVRVRDADWPAIARCFASLEAERPWALHRTPLVWELIRARHRVEPANGEAVNLLIRGGRGNVLAYCLGRRIVTADSYTVDEFACSNGNESLVGPLLRAAAGDLRKITGWLPPLPARNVLPRGTVRARRDAILMAVPLSRNARAQWKAHIDGIRSATGDAVWSSDHV
jgi:GNAT superfamily N-acetyltransferase